MEKENINFCRPDPKHFCVHCCEFFDGIFQPCPKLTTFSDNSQGCESHPLVINKPKNSQRRCMCESFQCWGDYSEQEQIKLQEIILNYPEGKFNMLQARKDLAEQK